VAVLPVKLLVEGETDEAVARTICSHLGLPTDIAYGKRGKEHLLNRLAAYNMAARFRPWFALVDLDNWRDCTAAFVSAKLPSSNRGMRFRVAVRTIEAWLLADEAHLAEFLIVSPAHIPADPDSVLQPKRAMVNLARGSRSRTIRQEMVPREGTGALVGPLYSARLREFAAMSWDPISAARRSVSLARCLRALSSLQDLDLSR
jgi:hypothetical protein